MTFSHAQLIKVAERWLRKHQKCTIVLADVNTWATTEQADAIGWSTSGFSTLIECKSSRSDFLRDAKKKTRKQPALGMGAVRFYVAPKGVIERKELPQGWGLITVSGARATPTLAFFAGQHAARNEAAEKQLLITALRRAVEGWGRRMFGDDAPANMVDGDAHPAPARIIRDLRKENARLRAKRDESIALFGALATHLEERKCAPSLDGYDLVSGLRAAADLLHGVEGPLVHHDDAAVDATVFRSANCITLAALAASASFQASCKNRLPKRR